MNPRRGQRGEEPHRSAAARGGARTAIARRPLPAAAGVVYNFGMLTIIDYQMGNLRSVQKAFESVGHAAAVSSDPREIAAADKLVLPGVGAFGDAMAELRRRALIGPIGEAVAAGKPLLGICLGLQLLFEQGFEDGVHEGLGVLAGCVRRFETPPGFKVPHMGWNQVALARRPPIFAEVPDNAYFYFVHSYFADPTDPQVVAGTTDYPAPFCSMVWRGNLFATQFHPEKSQAQGLRVLRNFAELAAAPAGPPPQAT